MKPRLFAAAPVFHVRDIRRSLEFYTAQLGFAVAQIWLEIEKPYAVLFRDGAEIHLMQGGPEALTRSSVYISTSDVDSAWEEFTANNAVIHAPAEDHIYGTRYFVVTDPDGQTLIFGQKWP